MPVLRRPRKVELRHHATLVSPQDRPAVAAVHVGPEREAVALWTGAGPGTSATIQNGADVREVSLHAQVPAFPMVQPLPDGQLLIVGRRAWWRDGAGERNATVFDSSGRKSYAACVGDGVADMQTTPSGAVWLSYFDEGVYGNLGWGTDGGPAPIGAPGLLRTTSTFEVDWVYPADSSEVIDDCYALSVNGETAWAYFYMDFSVARADEREVTLWRTEVSGARAMVTDGHGIALVGGYDAHDRVSSGVLDDALRRPSTARLLLPGAKPLPRQAVVRGRDAELHVFVGREWYRLDLDQL